MSDVDVEIPDGGSPGLNPGAIAGGVILLTLGATILLVDQGVIDTPVRKLIGPVVLIALGALMTFGRGGGGRTRPRRRNGATGGLWLIGIGAWQLLVQTHAFGFDNHNSWPVLIILSGVMLLIRGLR